jgi:hypothetical protein
MQVTGRRWRRHKQLLNDLKEKIGYWKLREKSLERTVWRIRFRRGCGPVVRQTVWWMTILAGVWGWLLWAGVCIFMCEWLIIRDRTFIVRGHTEVSVTEASRTCLVTEVTGCTLQVDTEPDVGAGDRNCLLPSVTRCDGSDSARQMHVWRRVSTSHRASQHARVSWLCSWFIYRCRPSFRGHVAATWEMITNYEETGVWRWLKRRNSTEMGKTIQIQTNQPTRCISLSDLLLIVQIQLNMFRASSRPSAGAYKL